MSVVFASAHLGIIHDQTTIEACETVEFLMRSVRSATKHRDAADRAGFGRGDQASRSFRAGERITPAGWTSLRPGVAGIDLLRGPAAHPLLATDVERMARSWPKLVRTDTNIDCNNILVPAYGVWAPRHSQLCAFDGIGFIRLGVGKLTVLRIEWTRPFHALGTISDAVSHRCSIV